MLLLWVTLDSASSSVAAAMAPATHIASTSQRKRTQNEPMARKMVSMCTCRTIRGPGDDLRAASGHRAADAVYHRWAMTTDER